MMGDNGQLFGWSEQAWLMLDQAGILLGNLTLLVSIIGAGWAWLRRESIRRWFTRNRFPEVGGTAEADAEWGALVFTVSMNEQVPRWVLQTLRPRFAAFVASESSRPAADRLAAHARGLGIEVLPARLVADPDDPADTRRETLALLQLVKDKGAGRVAVDLTGGKTPMSLGAFMAAEERQADTLYVTSEYENGKPRMDTAGIRCISRPNPAHRQAKNK
jgi:hypothetical protein